MTESPELTMYLVEGWSIMNVMSNAVLAAIVLVGSSLGGAATAAPASHPQPGCKVLSVATETTRDPAPVFPNFPDGIEWRGLVKITTTTLKCKGRTTQTVSMVLLMPAPTRPA